MIAFVAGAISVFGLAPFHIWPAFCIGVSVLLVLLAGSAQAGSAKARLGSGFGRAWCFAFGYFFFGLSWVGEAFLVDAEKFAALMPLAISILPAGLALFWGVAGAAFAMLKPRGALALPVFALVFSAVEVGRSVLFTGFPWNLPAYVWSGGGLMSQSAALVGPHGVGLLTLLMLAAPAVAGLSGWRTVWAVAASATLAALAYGGVRLSAPPATSDTQPVIAAGQAGFTMKELFDRANLDRIKDAYLRLLDSPEAQGADVIVWPEGAFPVFLMENEGLLSDIGARLGDRTLIVGTIRRDLRGMGTNLHNSMIALRNTTPGDPSSLAVIGLADKHHLVPFGEYLPFRDAFAALGVDDLIAYEGDMISAPAPSVLTIPGLPPADARVCYEVIFPGFNPAATGVTQWIVNVSVDSWYGDGLGPHQHFNQARWRAIETGQPLVRAASGGWSAIVDPYGRVLDSTRDGTRLARARLPVSVGN
jgi:apolipoprotein N-acyltransferase